MAELPDQSWRKTLKRRLAVASGVLLLWSAAIEARLVYLQVIEHDFYVAAARERQLDAVEVPAQRGDILDRNGNLLAYSVAADSISADPKSVNPAQLIATLCGVLDRPCTPGERETFRSNLTKRDARGELKDFAWLRRWVSPEDARRVTELELDGVSLTREMRRYYPNGGLAAHVLGHVNDENVGASGIEAKYQREVGGEAGRALVQIDRQKRRFSRVELSPPRTGASLELTIDSYVQHVAESALAAGVERSGAAGGSVIVQNPFTGEVLALANSPTFNPNPIAHKGFSSEIKRNRAVQEPYEPGSTIKAVLAAAVLEEQVVRPSELINTSPGILRIGARVIDEAQGHNYGTLTFEDVIVKSSNVGAVKIGLKLGADRMVSYLKRFGFLSRLSPDFNGESAGILGRQLDNNAVASMSMGYAVSVTPLQMASAISSIANGGELIEPRVVRAIIKDGVRVEFPRKVLRRTISASTAKQLIPIMEGVVERGTAKAAQIAGYTIAGKTGTAAKSLGPRGYSTTDYNVSFVGFAPSRDPAFTIVVVIDTPTKISPYGGTVAAPVFQTIADALLRHYAVPPTLNRDPAVVIARRDEVREQPVSGPAVPVVVTVADHSTESPTVVPDLLGLSARDAVRALAGVGITPRIRGDGFVVDQRPAPGSALDSTYTATLRLERRPPTQRPTPESPTPDAAGVARGRP